MNKGLVKILEEAKKLFEKSVQTHLPSQLKFRLSPVFVVVWGIRGRFFICCGVVAVVLGVGGGGIFKLAEPVRGDINKLVEGRYVHPTSGEVRNDSESGDRPVKDRTIEFRNDVRTASVSGNDN